jgi:hypothetical protein
MKGDFFIRSISFELDLEHAQYFDKASNFFIELANNELSSEINRFELSDSSASLRLDKITIDLGEIDLNQPNIKYYILKQFRNQFRQLLEEHFLSVHQIGNYINENLLYYYLTEGHFPWGIRSKSDFLSRVARSSLSEKAILKIIFILENNENAKNRWIQLLKEKAFIHYLKEFLNGNLYSNYRLIPPVSFVNLLFDYSLLRNAKIHIYRAVKNKSYRDTINISASLISDYIDLGKTTRSIFYLKNEIQKDFEFLFLHHRETFYQIVDNVNIKNKLSLIRMMQLISKKILLSLRDYKYSEGQLQVIRKVIDRFNFFSGVDIKSDYVYVLAFKIARSSQENDSLKEFEKQLLGALSFFVSKISGSQNFSKGLPPNKEGRYSKLDLNTRNREGNKNRDISDLANISSDYLNASLGFDNREKSFYIKDIVAKWQGFLRNVLKNYGIIDFNLKIIDLLFVEGLLILAKTDQSSFFNGLNWTKAKSSEFFEKFFSEQGGLYSTTSLLSFFAKKKQTFDELELLFTYYKTVSTLNLPYGDAFYGKLLGLILSSKQLISHRSFLVFLDLIQWERDLSKNAELVKVHNEQLLHLFTIEKTKKHLDSKKVDGILGILLKEKLDLIETINPSTSERTNSQRLHEVSDDNLDVKGLTDHLVNSSPIHSEVFASFSKDVDSTYLEELIDYHSDVISLDFNDNREKSFYIKDIVAKWQGFLRNVLKNYGIIDFNLKIIDLLFVEGLLILAKTDQSSFFNGLNWTKAKSSEFFEKFFSEQGGLYSTTSLLSFFAKKKQTFDELELLFTYYKTVSTLNLPYGDAFYGKLLGLILSSKQLISHRSFLVFLDLIQWERDLSKNAELVKVHNEQLLHLFTIEKTKKHLDSKKVDGILGILLKEKLDLIETINPSTSERTNSQRLHEVSDDNLDVKGLTDHLVNSSPIHSEVFASFSKDVDSTYLEELIDYHSDVISLDFNESILKTNFSADVFFSEIVENGQVRVFLRRIRFLDELMTVLAQISLRAPFSESLLLAIDDKKDTAIHLERLLIELNDKYRFSSEGQKEFRLSIRQILLKYTSTLALTRSFDQFDFFSSFFEFSLARGILRPASLAKSLEYFSEDELKTLPLKAAIFQTVKKLNQPMINESIRLGQFRKDLVLYLLTYNENPFWNESSKFSLNDALEYTMSAVYSRNFEFIKQVMIHSNSRCTFLNHLTLIDSAEHRIALLKLHCENDSVVEFFIEVFARFERSSLLKESIGIYNSLNIFISKTVLRRNSELGLLNALFNETLSFLPSLNMRKFLTELGLEMFIAKSISKEQSSLKPLDFDIKYQLIYFLDTGLFIGDLQNFKKSDLKKRFIKVLQENRDFLKDIFLRFSAFPEEMVRLIELIGVQELLLFIEEWLFDLNYKRRAYYQLSIEFILTLPNSYDQANTLSRLFKGRSISSDVQFFKRGYVIWRELFVEYETKFIQFLESKSAIRNSIFELKKETDLILASKVIDHNTAIIQEKDNYLDELTVVSKLYPKINRLENRISKDASLINDKLDLSALEYYVKYGSLNFVNYDFTLENLSSIANFLVENELIFMRKFLFNWTASPSMIRRFVNLIRQDRRLSVLSIIDGDFLDELALYKQIIEQVYKSKFSLDQFLPTTDAEMVLMFLKVWRKLGYFQSSSISIIYKTHLMLLGNKSYPLSSFFDDLKKTEFKGPITKSFFLKEFTHYSEIGLKENNGQRSIDNSQTDLDKGETISISNAGIVILWPYLYRLFDKLSLITDKKLKDDQRSKAVVLIHYLAFGNTDYTENDLLLNKILCGLNSVDYVGDDVHLSSFETETCNSLLNAVTKNWDKLSSTSIDSFRVSFLQRNGALKYDAQEFYLTVENKAYDVLLETLPWSISMIQTVFMKRRLLVDWKTKMK